MSVSFFAVIRNAVMVIALTILIMLMGSSQQNSFVQGFSPGLASHCRNINNNNNNNNNNHVATTTIKEFARTRSTTTSLFGILDDMMSTTTGDERPTATTTTTTTEEEEEEIIDSDKEEQQLHHQDLFHALIFSTNTQADIANQLEACTQPEFLQYLIKSRDQSEDDEERQGLQELLDLIDEVQTSLLASKQQEDAAALAAAAAAAAAVANLDSTAATSLEKEEETPPKKKELLISNTEVIKRANQLDQAMVAGAASDDEKPSDFISDCREVVNLSRGFNNQGQMRVGGR
jgi:hypothetical protein